MTPPGILPWHLLFCEWQVLVRKHGDSSLSAASKWLLTHSFTPSPPSPFPQLPAGDWYCCWECSVIRDQLDLWVQQGDIAIGGTHSLQVRLLHPLLA